MLNEDDRDPSDEQAVLDAISAAREVYPNEEFRAWADAWVDGRDREQRSAEAIATRIRSDWFLPDPDGKKWERRVIELLEAGETHEKIEAELADKVLAESSETPVPIDPEAEANMLASQSALAAALAAQADALDGLDPGFLEGELRLLLLNAKACAASCKRLREELAPTGGK